jgi:Zinc knuckle
MRVVKFLNSLSEVSALYAVLSALRATDELSWIKATTQILLESDMKGVNNKGREYPERAMVASTGFAGTCYTCGEAGHRSLDNFDQGRHHNRYLTRHGARGETTLIVAMVIVALTIVSSTWPRFRQVIRTCRRLHRRSHRPQYCCPREPRRAQPGCFERVCACHTSRNRVRASAQNSG